MNYFLLLLALFSSIGYGQKKEKDTSTQQTENTYIQPSFQLTQHAAFELLIRANQKAKELNKSVSIAILDDSGNSILVAQGDGVGPHNTEAARRKAFTALSTKTSTWVLLRNAEQSLDTKNLATLPELLLLSGGRPILYNGKLIGSVGVAGGGSPENDDIIAKAAAIPEFSITTIN